MQKILFLGLFVSSSLSTRFFNHDEIQKLECFPDIGGGLKAELWPNVVSCVFHRKGFTDDKGEFKIDVLKQKLSKFQDDKYLVNEIAELCVDKHDFTMTAAMKSALCLNKHAPWFSPYQD
ncbi:odorant binding protein C08 [Tribolium castaneum]|uniref:Odorant binding protein C08 n=1 Tax=Tribolium castaneum TaxID=7070 RepID=D6WS45_TRICA|nr:odorant binding protein C08 [Tribolium castaneum]